MSGDKRFFVDTNVFLYSVDTNDCLKNHMAQRWLDALWASGSGRISWQVLHEYYVNATKKMGVPPEIARERVELLSVWGPVDSSLPLVRRAWHWSDSAQLSYWDSLIVAAAELSGCSYLVSEDLQNERRLGEILIVNPFLHSPDEFRL